ncbi:uncharacterized protein LOC144713176 isoform X1 [Wolffia australiana]
MAFQDVYSRAQILPDMASCPSSIQGLKPRSHSSKKAKFLCSYGGKILPRPSDGVLRYVGGHTRIIALCKDASLQEVISKMEEIINGPAILKYQLPGEDLDSLVTVSCAEDLENMIEEYDKLARESSPEGSSKLRIFLFRPADSDIWCVRSSSEFISHEQSYIELVNNGVAKEAIGFSRKESATSLSSVEPIESANEMNSLSISIPTISSSSESPDASINPSCDEQPSPSQFVHPTAVEEAYLPAAYMEPVDLAQIPYQIEIINPQQPAAAPNLPQIPCQIGIINTQHPEAAPNLAPFPWFPYVPAVPISDLPVPPFPSSLLQQASPPRKQFVQNYEDAGEEHSSSDIHGCHMNLSDLLGPCSTNLADPISTRTDQETVTVGNNDPLMMGFDSQVGTYFPIEGAIQSFCMSFADDSSCLKESEVKVETVTFLAEASVPQQIEDDDFFKLVEVDPYLKSPPTEDPVATNVLEGTREDTVKMELQAIAVDVASSVLLPSTPENDDRPGLERNQNPQSQTDEGYDSTDQLKIDFQPLDGISHLQIIKNSDIEELEELGSGTFGTVYHGKWRGSDVAIKRISTSCFTGKKSEQERMRDDFWNEACKLSDLHHPNVVAFYGVVLNGPGGSVATVTEFMANGSLRQALQRSHKSLDRRKLLIIAMDVACGMEYLHGKNIVHFDLKSDNLLVNLRDPQRPICKVGDLGLSKVKRQTLISGGVRGTLPWMAPELLNGSSSLVSEKVDVFSFAIVMWELLTGEEPYADLHYGAIIGGIVNDTLRPPVPDTCDPDWRSLMERCWSSEPSDRPSFAEISFQLRAMACPPAEKVDKLFEPR